MTSPCPNKDVCGSCSWSHIPYEKQLQQKLSDINGSFALKELDVQCEEILASPVTEHYRNRMDFVIDFEGRFGMRQKGKWWRVIDGHHCFLADEQIEKMFGQVEAWLKTANLTFFDRKAHTGLLRYAVLRSTTQGETMLNIITSAPADADEEASVQAALADLTETAQPTTLIWSINHTVSDVSFGEELRVVHGPGVIEEIVNGRKYRISPNAFFQTNPRGAALLMDTVLEFAGDTSEKTVLDLYCGTGFFAIGFGGAAKRIVGAEAVSDAIKDARVNAELNNLNIEFHDVKTEEFDWGSYNADLVILDPPRSGLHDKALEDVLRIAPKEIVYISCKYKNFARELVQLQTKYDVVSMRAIDMFPHTPHVELVTKLVLRD